MTHVVGRYGIGVATKKTTPRKEGQAVHPRNEVKKEGWGLVGGVAICKKKRPSKGGVGGDARRRKVCHGQLQKNNPSKGGVGSHVIGSNKNNPSKGGAGSALLYKKEI